MFERHVVEVNGYTYAAELAAARAEVIAAKAHAQAAKAAHRDPGLAQIHIMDMMTVVEDQMDNIHRILYDTCSCSWMIPDVRHLGGHLNLRTLQPATGLILADRDGYSAAACQECGLITPCANIEQARMAQYEHTCVSTRP